MTETFIINKLMIKSKGSTRLERLQQDKDTIAQLDICYIISISKSCQLIVVDLSKQKEFDADSRAIQKIEFYGMLKTDSQVCTVLEESKEAILKSYKGTAKVL